MAVTLTRVICLVQWANTEKKGGRGSEKMKVNGRGKVEIRTKNSWQQTKHAWLYSDLLKALNRKPFGALGSQQTGP